MLLASLSLSALASAQPPHLAQAWEAMSTGDGMKGATGKESYIYEDCHKPTDTCMSGHVWNYGADTCIKYEVDRGINSPYTGTYYVKCDATDCCASDDPDIKKWDIGQAGKWLGDKITYLGKMNTTELGGKEVNADAYTEIFNLPFTKAKINYTYYVTTDGDDTITHRIDYSTPGISKLKAGSILYGDFKVMHNLTSFRDVFKAPAACLKPNVLKCPPSKVEEWDQKYFSR